MLSERLSASLKAADLGGSSATLKLKTADFGARARSDPTQIAAKIFAGPDRELLRREADGTKFRLIGLSSTPLAAILTILSTRGDGVRRLSMRSIKSAPHSARAAMVRGGAFNTATEG